MEQQVLEIIKRNPQVLIEAINGYQKERVRADRVSEWRKAVDAPTTFDLRNAPVIGPSNATTTIVEVADFECIFCAAAQPAIKELLEHYKGEVRLAFIHYPLPNHPQARSAALAAWAAWRQGKFFEYQNRLFELNGNIQANTLTTAAQSVGLDMGRFEMDRNSPEAAKQIDTDVEQAKHAGLSGTPIFVVNGILVRGALSIEDFEQLRAISRGKARDPERR